MGELVTIGRSEVYGLTGLTQGKALKSPWIITSLTKVKILGEGEEAAGRNSGA